MADGYHSKKPIVSNCAIILISADMRASDSQLLFGVCNQFLKIHSDKGVVAMLAAIMKEARYHDGKFSF